MRNLFCFAVGLTFGVGLCLSGMTAPDKVLGFLDLAGEWDPSLALVLGGAVAIGLVGFGMARRRGHALLGGVMDIPRRRDIDGRLIAGSLIFGVGWGLAGICPGPGIVDVGFLDPRAIVFVAAMAAAMLAYELGLPAPGPIRQDA